MDHKAYQRRLRALPLDSLNYIIRDCQEALDANPANPKASDYLDEQHYCRMEKARRVRTTRTK